MYYDIDIQLANSPVCIKLANGFEWIMIYPIYLMACRYKAGSIIDLGKHRKYKWSQTFGHLCCVCQCAQDFDDDVDASAEVATTAIPSVLLRRWRHRNVGLTGLRMRYRGQRPFAESLLRPA